MRNGHLPKMDELRKRGAGLALLHFATIIDKGPLADRALEWAGGYDEADWSVVKWWKADFKRIGSVEGVSRAYKLTRLHDSHD